jgi:hypothetical protein
MVHGEPKMPRLARKAARVVLVAAGVDSLAFPPDALESARRTEEMVLQGQALPLRGKRISSRDQLPRCGQLLVSLRRLIIAACRQLRLQSRR